MQEGRIVEEGTYEQLMNKHGAFCDLMNDFGGAKEQQNEDDAEKEEAALQLPSAEQQRAVFSKKRLGKASGSGKLEVSLFH